MPRCSCVNLRPLAALLVFAVALLFARAGHAQIAPVFPAVDGNGVDVTTGTYNLANTDVVIGQPDKGGLALVRYQTSTSGSWSYNHVGFLTSTGAGGLTCVVVIGTSTETFTSTSPGCQGSSSSDQQRGASLAYQNDGTYTYTSADGVVATFQQPAAGSGLGIVGMPTPLIAYLSSIATPDGVVTNYVYETEGPFCFPDPQNCYSQQTFGRLKLVKNNLGYRLVFEYSASIQLGGVLNRVTGINTIDEYCGGSDCTPGKWPYALYGYTNGNLTTVTDALGKVTTYGYAGGPGGVTTIQFPDNASHNINITYTSGRVSNVNFGWGDFGYSYDDSAAPNRTTTVTNPDHTTTRKYVSTIGGRVNSITNELNQTVTYAYDSALRQTKVTLPEGNYTQFTYDGRGNITETRQVSKTPHTPADIVTSANYDVLCGNPVTCNKPNYTIDARGLKTEYTYDSVHGGVLTVTAPAPSGPAPVGSGARPQTRFTYTQVQARYLTGVGVWSTGSAVWRLTSTSACAVSASCTNGAEETRTTITYPPSSTPNNLLPSSTTVASGDGTVSSSTAMTYTVAGDVLTVDGPLAGSNDTTRFYYDQLRRPTGVVGPNPNVPGLNYRAVKTTYNDIGQVTAVERGAAGSQSATFPSLTVLEKQETGYDAYARPIYSRLSDGTNYGALTQVSYDNNGRRLCTAVRMDPANFATPPANACVAGGGGFGPDRITYETYDEVGRVVSEQQAHGTSQVQTVATNAYTTNGQIASVKNARNFLTTYEYDGLDRLVKRRYPDPSTTNSSSLTDFEQINYDSSGLVQSQVRRDGQSFTFTYDNLDRVTLRHDSGTQADVAYGYDLLGRMTSVSQSGLSISTVYDALSRVLSQTSSAFGTGPGTVSYTYDAAGRRTRTTYPDTFFVGYTYDTVGDLTQIHENSDTATVLATYAYDDLGRRTSLTRGNGAVTNYTYDAVSRLATLVQNPTGTSYDTSIGFSYNPAGQITSRSNSAAVFDPMPAAVGSKSYIADGLDKYTTATGYSPAYGDSRGNLTSDGFKTYGYDADNRLTSAGSATLDYDPAGRLYRVAGGTTTRFLYDGNEPILEYDDNNASPHVLQRYVHGPGVDEPLVWYEGSTITNRKWPLADERGSVIGIADDAGNVTRVNRYDADGVPDAANQGRFQYTGQMWIPEVGAYSFKARFYHPGLGRFMQTDPIDFAGGMNLYGYAGNDPLNNIDPSGTSWLDDIFHVFCMAGFWCPSYNSNDCDDDCQAQRRAAAAEDQLRHGIADRPGGPASGTPMAGAPGNGGGAAPQRDNQSAQNCPAPGHSRDRERPELPWGNVDSVVLYPAGGLNGQGSANFLTVQLAPGPNSLMFSFANRDTGVFAQIMSATDNPVRLSINIQATTATGPVQSSYSITQQIAPGSSIFTSVPGKFTGPGNVTAVVANRGGYTTGITLRAQSLACP